MTALRTVEDISGLKFDAAGLIPVVTQDAASGRVLMVAWADREALEQTLATNQMHYHSRRTGTLWQKGQTSGATQELLSLTADCDGDTLLAMVRQQGTGACHTGTLTCFDPVEATSSLPDGDIRILGTLLQVIARRARDLPEGSYTTELLKDRPRALRKIAEEAIEVVIAASHEGRARTTEESADLLFHLLVVLRAEGIDLAEVWRVLAQRHGTAMQQRPG